MESLRLDGLILAGGAGSRMGGLDKGLVRYRGRPLVSYAVDLLRPLCQRVVISANRHLEIYARYGDAVASDDAAGFQGPMAGLLAGSRIASAPFLLVVPCDMPEIAPGLLDEMIQAMPAEGGEVLVADDGERLQPLLMVMDRRFSASLETAFGRGTRAVRDWLEEIPHRRIDVSRWRSTLNHCNTQTAIQEMTEEPGVGL